MKSLMTFLTVSALSGPALAGGYSGDQTVSARLTVGAASSCSGSVTETPITNSLKSTGSSTVVGNVTVNCPGATYIIAGLIGVDGKIGEQLRNSKATGTFSVQGPFWMTNFIRGQTADMEVELHTSGESEIIQIHDSRNLDLPSSVGSASKIDGSQGTFQIRLSTKCNNDTCTLNTGSYPYLIKLMGYWE